MDVFKFNRCDLKMLIFLIFLWFCNLSAEGTKCEIDENLCELYCRYNATLELGYSTACKSFYIIEFANTDIDSNKLQNLKYHSFVNLYFDQINNIENVRHAFKGLNINSLYINYHNIKELKTDMFEESGLFERVLLYRNDIEVLQRKSIPKAKYVNLNNNLIKTITPDMFSDISYVEALYLSHNHIRTITASSLIGLKGNTLDLSYNYIQELKDSSIPEVEDVFLHYNKLVSIHSKIFVNISKIDILDVSNNIIKDFSFQNSRFYRLNMNYNEITNLSNKFFSGMNVQREVLLKNNKISSLEIKSIPLVNKLDLSYNFLTCIDFNMFTDIDQVRHLDLTYNCMEEINLEFPKEVNVSSGLYNKMCKWNDIPETKNEMSEWNDIQETDNVLFRKIDFI